MKTYNILNLIERNIFKKSILNFFDKEKIGYLNIYIEDNVYFFILGIHFRENKYFLRLKLIEILKKFNHMENQIYKIIFEELEKPYLNARICNIELCNQYGSRPIKILASNIINKCMEEGALGVRIIFDGKLFGLRNKKKFFQKGYIKLTGNPKIQNLEIFQKQLLLKQGVINICVVIMKKTKNLIDLNIRDYLNEKK